MISSKPAESQTQHNITAEQCTSFLIIFAHYNAPYQSFIMSNYTLYSTEAAWT